MTKQLYNNNFITVVLKTSVIVFVASASCYLAQFLIEEMARSVQERLRAIRREGSDSLTDIGFHPDDLLSEDLFEEQSDKAETSTKKAAKPLPTRRNPDIQELKVMIRTLTDTVKDMSIKLDNIIAFQKRYEDNLPAIPGTSKQLLHTAPTHLTKDNFQL